MTIVAEYKTNNLEATMYKLNDGSYLATSNITLTIQEDPKTYHQSSAFTPDQEKITDVTIDGFTRYFKRNLMAIVLKHMDNIKNSTHELYENTLSAISNDFVALDPDEV